MTLAPSDRRQLTVLPMAGRTHGNRSPVTCHLRCGDACFQPVPNTSDNGYFRDVASRALSRRRLLASAGAATAVAAAAPALASPAAAAPPVGRAPGGRGRRPAAVHPDRAGAGRRRRRHRAGRVRLAPGDPLGRPDPRRRAAVRRRGPDPPRPGRPVRLQLRLPRHHRDERAGHQGAAGGEPRVHQREHHVPAGDGCRDEDPHRLGGARHVGGRARAAPSRAALDLREAGTQEPPHHPRHPVHLRRPGPRLGAAAHRGGPARRPGARHDEQLRRRHHAVGHGALGRGELQPVLPRHRHRPPREALRTRRQPGHAQLAFGRTPGGTPPARPTATSPTASAGSSRSTRRGPAPRR